MSTLPSRQNRGLGVSGFPSPFIESSVKITKVRKIASNRRDTNPSLAEFVNMLNSMRRGIVTPEITERMNQLSREVVYHDGIEPTDLWVHASSRLGCVLKAVEVSD